MKNWKYLCPFVVFYIFALMSCTSTTKIQAVDKSGSVDKKTDIYINGSYKGSGEVHYSYNNIFSPAEIILKKDQCQPIKSKLYFNTNIPKAIGGGVLGGLFGFFLVGGKQASNVASLGRIPATLIFVSAFVLSPAIFGYLFSRELKDMYTYNSHCVSTKSDF